MIKPTQLCKIKHHFPIRFIDFLGRKLMGVLLVIISSIGFAQQVDAQQEFVPIFNGKDLDGWHISKTNHHGTMGNFYVEDGAIVMKQYPYGQGGIILTDKKYQDFELSLEFKGYPGTNGGIFLRSSESGSAYQLELAGDGERGTGNLIGELQRTTINARIENIEEVWKKGEWNSFRIRMTGEIPKVSLWINGEHMWDAEGERNDLIGDVTDGMIAFQLHWSATLQPVPGGRCCDFSWRPDASHQFRNVMIKELKPAKALMSSGSQFAQQSQALVSDSFDMEFIRIEPGKMLVGKIEIECPSFPDTRDVADESKWTEQEFKLCQEMAERDSRPGFWVTMDQPYFIGKYEVTQGQWKKIMGSNPSIFNAEKVGELTDLHPVDNVTWEMVQGFVTKLNAMESIYRYRLPTEFEWEYAARAGNDELLSWSETSQQAWIQQTDKGTAKQVGTKKPNAWGLYDMLGNVWEWVGDYYNNDVFADPIPPGKGEVHVLKGGSITSDVTNATYLYHGAGPGNGYDVGFRLVREIR
ncbi:SUMF1/EgtB/PvdO family nonheme iron enzyme [Algoriphagus sp. D3-2-R+10]|uniref:SUMF1/EgtB/PvdO family nonheme iron enzyme n=1 Tax=Algoriphagus aurantiacus TaxID=3103948 RepID=UPI002B38E0B3|nr:SUMF1/EgtB/PvdO family nonheme iron enzyme [Algoriphagus sp. D3-2-R+10]MEB2777716.1 SUMF1/EgtB/PvdO family nonheme iron enzyme [Algoriphagus sp. D3-2-R+10]